MGKIEGRRRRGRQGMRWLHGITNSMDMSLSKLWQLVVNSLVCYSPWSHRESDVTEWLNWCMHVCCHFSSFWLFSTLWTVSCQAFVSMGFSREEHWSGLPCHCPRDLPDSGIEPMSPETLPLQADFLLLSHQVSPSDLLYSYNKQDSVMSVNKIDRDLYILK